MKWRDCVEIYRKTIIDIYGHCNENLNRKKTDIWLELYDTRVQNDLKRSVQMSLEIIKNHLIEHDDVDGIDFIFTEIANRHKITMKMYLSKRDNLELSIGENMIDISTYFRSYKIIGWLLGRGIDPFNFNSQGISAISRAFETGNTYLISTYMKLRTNNNLTVIEIYGLLCMKNKNIMKLLKLTKGTSLVYNLYKTKLEDGLHLEP